MATKDHTPTLRELFLAKINADPYTVSLEDWPAYAANNAGTDAAFFAQETPAASKAEQKLVNKLRAVFEGTRELRDLRDFAKVARAIFPETEYLVGAAGSHVYVHTRAAGSHAQPGGNRLAIIYTAAGGRIWNDHRQLAPLSPLGEAALSPLGESAPQ
jgi:hypothetical protein